MKKTVLNTAMTAALISLPLMSHADSPYFSLKDGDGFKRFSVSVGALHVMPQGKAQPININTAVNEGQKSRVGDVKVDSVLNAIDESKEGATAKKGLLKTAVDLDILGLISFNKDGDKYLKSNVAGEATLTGLSNWQAQGTGLEADDVTTLGILTNYFFTDNVSLEIKAGIPPKVDIQGKGQIFAPLSGVASPEGIGQIVGDLPLKKDIFITDLSGHGQVAEARAWTPAFEFQYHFGKTGVNKFRPYVGLGLMYAYFNDLEMNPNLEKDLIAAGHKIANIKNGAAGAALDNKESTANPKVSLEASDAFAPVATVGFTYDFNDRWFAVGSVSYAHLTGETTITVRDEQLGELINAKSDIEINPILGYAGIGYRF
ncbi:MAG: OmpW family protein [Candidatus Acinetobacter avistercoris]|uniref:OmpW/AlkL family protein n=1 Tax=Acinetobacter sp. KS-LM10 TaxID=3120518 RepID=UPI001F9666D6|nr:OmpW family protein [Candidatus Acinetobacter avistercoris]